MPSASVQDCQRRNCGELPAAATLANCLKCGYFRPVPCYYAVWLSDNPGPSIEEDGSPTGVIVTEIKDRLAEAPKTNLFAMACSGFELGCPRISSVLPFLEDFNPAAGWRSVVIGTQRFWTNREPNSFPAPKRPLSFFPWPSQ